MSADNFVVIRKLHDGYRWGSFSMSYDSETELKDLPKNKFMNGPFESVDKCMEELHKLEDNGYVIEYGISVYKET